MTFDCPIPRLRTFLEHLFHNHYGFTVNQAANISDALISADSHGIQSHGVQRLAKCMTQSSKPVPLLQVTKDESFSQSDATSLIDGELGMGQVIAHKAMGLSIETAQRYGIGIVAVRNSKPFRDSRTLGTYGTGGGFHRIGLHHNSNPLTVPTFGVCPFGGNNPIAFSAPGDPEDFEFRDAATSTVSLGKIESPFAKPEMQFPDNGQ